MASSLNGTGITFSDGSSQPTAFSGARGQVFTANGTFTIPAGVTALKVSVLGGGAGGATVPTTNSQFASCGGGGGGVAIKFLTGLTSGATLSVTIGNGGAANSSGGTSSVASGTQVISTISATGGSTGGSTSLSAYVSVGSGGVGSGGDLNITGGYSAIGGQVGAGCLSSRNYGGAGGGGGGGVPTSVHSGIYGAVAPASGVFGGISGYLNYKDGSSSGVTAGQAATGYGNGGQGGCKTGSTSAAAGGAGSGGLVIFEW